MSRETSVLGHGLVVGTSLVSPNSQTVRLLDPWDHPIVQSDERYDGEFVERRKTCFKSELFDQVWISCFNDPKKVCSNAE